MTQAVNVQILKPCPPHQWAHAPTVGYFICSKCNERVNYDDPRYETMLKESAHQIAQMTQADANVELIARALYAERPFAMASTATSFGHQIAKTFDWDGAPAYYQEDMLQLARAAVAALNSRVEPTLHPLPSEDTEIFAAIRVERNEPGSADNGGRVVVTFHDDEQLGQIHRALGVGWADTAMQRSTPTAPVQGDDADAKWLRGHVTEMCPGQADRLERIASRLSGDNNAALVEVLNMRLFLDTAIKHKLETETHGGLTQFGEGGLAALRSLEREFDRLSALRTQAATQKEAE